LQVLSYCQVSQMSIPEVTISFRAPICYNNWYQSISISQQLVSELKVDEG